MAKDRYLSRITTGVAAGGAIGGAFGAVHGTYEAFSRRIPGLMKIRHVGQATLGYASIFGLFVGAGSLIHHGMSYKESSLDRTNNKNLS
nr:reactive oxygen species modulator 1 [Tanacetum cinerariifolium]GEY55018.1 reactive oxygen species modulator 1 [Tanacetum cinerariifolium]